MENEETSKASTDDSDSCSVNMNIVHTKTGIRTAAVMGSSKYF